jgi:hypothetical protein
MIKGNRRLNILAICVVILVTLSMLLGACGGKNEPPPTTQPSSPPVGPAGNRPPIISSLTAAQGQVYPNGSSEVQVVAADPDGDDVLITWAATGGRFSGSGYVVTWQGPNEYGVYEITATASDGKGGTAQQTTTISVGANQAPLITSLSADPPTVGPRGSSTITCIANDPDGDVIKYTWQTDEGSISGVGNKVTLVAPNKAGVFNVKVVASDGKGGDTIGTVPVTVATATKTELINFIQQETGTVSKDNKDNTLTKAGDDDQNRGYRAFWSFNISGLNQTEIKNARLIFTTRNVVGAPFTRVGGASLGGLFIMQVKYADQLPSFDTIGTSLYFARAAMFEPPTTIDVTPEVGQLVNSGAPRFCIVAKFDKQFNGNSISEWIEWSDVKLEVTYTEK